MKIEYLSNRPYLMVASGAYFFNIPRDPHLGRNQKLMLLSRRLHMSCAKHGYASCHFGCIGGDAWGRDSTTPDHGMYPDRPTNTRFGTTKKDGAFLNSDSCSLYQSRVRVNVTVVPRLPHCAILVAQFLTIFQDAFGGKKSCKSELPDNNSGVPNPINFL